MRALLYLLTLTLGCFLENGYCGKALAFKSNADAVALAEQYENNRLPKTVFLQQVNGMGFQQNERTIRRYIEKLKKEGIISSEQAPNSNPSFTHDDTSPYGQGPSSNPSYTHDDTTPYGQASNSNQQAINYQTNEYENNTYWRNTHHSNDQVKLPHHGDDYKHWMVENE
uniref:Uncharacterized protein n=1 Tax=Globodera pallida TaxID=36090 RepID=A0A183CJI8_GLOPA